jgi:hypothetical protein
MRLYNSFLVRCWLIRSAPEGERSVLDIEHIQTGEHFRPSSLSEAEGWMYETLYREGENAAPRPPAEDLNE